MIDYSEHVIDITFYNVAYLAKCSPLQDISYRKKEKCLLGPVLMAASLLSDHSDSIIRVCFESFLTLNTNDRMSTQTQSPSFEIHRQRTPTHSAPWVSILQKISPAPCCQFELLPLGFCLCHTEWTTDRHRASSLPQAIQSQDKTGLEHKPMHLM